MQHNFKGLTAWKKARLLAKNIYTVTRNFPKEEMFGLTNQMRRASVSISSNIAEGCGRGTNAQTIHFLNVAMGSSTELESQIYLAKDLNFITESQEQEIIELIKEVQKLIFGFKKKIS